LPNVAFLFAETTMIRASIAAAATAVAFGAALFLAAPSYAQQASLEGSWSGSGKVTFPSGESETARCRVSFQKRGGDRFGMNAICASPSGRVVQTAQLSRDGGNRYSGEFINKEYGVSGSISVTLRGNALTASLNGGGATASFSLSR
jgi:hypothetical protein